MLSHTGTLWHYLSSFVLYTLGAVALIYGAYWYARRSTSGPLPGLSKKVEPETPLMLESTLALEPRKNLYVIRAGKERFLVSTSGEDTHLLSKLEPVPAEVAAAELIPEVEATPRLEPWYAHSQPVRPVVPRSNGFGARFVQSVQWLVASRMK